MKALKKIIFVTAFLMLFALTSMVSAYEFLSVFQDDGSSDHVVEAPSFFWDGACEVNINLLGTASHTGTFTFSNEWFSPDDILFATSTPTYPNDITCLTQGIPSEDTSLNDFFESKTETLSTATSTDTWIRTTYNCTPDENLDVLYSNTAVLDSHGHFPYGYLENTGGYCTVGSPGAFPALSTRLNNAINYIIDRYDTECSSQDLEIAEIGGASSGSCGINRFFATTFWYLVPFNSGSAGVVNISILEQIQRETGECSVTCITNNTFIYDTVLNSTTSIGISLPLTQNLVLQRDRDYWLFIGTECVGGTGAAIPCTVDFNHTEYNISIFAYDPIFVCGEFSECQSGIQTRICEDINNLVPDLIETRACFDTPTFDLTLGFEETAVTQDGVYICTKQFFTCFDVLSTIDAEYPVNWTVFPDFDDADIARDNFIKMSSETSSVGSKSLKMWYIPPKINEPIPDGTSTQCGNGSTGSFPEVQHPYNETLFVSQNVTFENPFAQIRYDVRKCNEPVLQYDYTGDLLGFNCGQMCYASACNDTPQGRYGVRISRLEGQMITSFPSFSFFDDSGNNETENVTDDDIDTFADFSSSAPGATVNSTENIFFNGTFLNFTVNATGSLDLCINDGATELTRVSLTSGATLFNFTVILGNISSPTNEINLEQCIPPARTVQMRLFLIRNEVELMDSEILFDYIAEAPDTWDEGQIIHDLSNIGLQTGLNYTISLSINPENQFDPQTHCAYLDNFRVTFTEIALPECVSECIVGSIDRRIARFSNGQNGAGGICTFITQINSPDCIALQSERDEVENILLGLGGGDITDNSTCIDSDNDGISDDLYIFDAIIGSSELIIDSEACLLLINQTLTELANTEPLPDTSSYIGFFDFIFSPIFIYVIFSLIISGILSAGIARVTKNGDGVFQVFGVTMMIFFFLGSLPGIAVIPIWISVAVIAVISLLIAQKLRQTGFSVGGG